MNSRTWGAPDRPLVILLHALACHSGWWDWVAPELAERFRVVAPDFRGHGGSPHADDYSFRAYAADVEALIGSLGARPFALVGHSMGGYVALTVAARQVRRPVAVVVADMKTAAGEQELADLQAAARRPCRTYATLDEAVARYRLSPPEHCVPAERLAAVARDCYRQQPDGTWVEKFDRRALAIEPLAPRDLAVRAACPLLLVRGERSPVMPADAAAALAQAVGAPLVQLAGLNHHLLLEDPMQLAGEVRRFLEGIHNFI